MTSEAILHDLTVEGCLCYDIICVFFRYIFISHYIFASTQEKLVSLIFELMMNNNNSWLSFQNRNNSFIVYRMSSTHHSNCFPPFHHSTQLCAQTLSSTCIFWKSSSAPLLTLGSSKLAWLIKIQDFFFFFILADCLITLLSGLILC